MKNEILALAAATLAISGAASVPAYAGQATAEKGEARLAKMIEGRTAGSPVTCVSALNSNRMEVIDETAIVYDAGKTVYVGRPIDPSVLDPNDVLVTKRYGSQFCASDSMRMVDRDGGFMTGIVFLKNFVPYTKEG
jgi:hypothetical protein